MNPGALVALSGGVDSALALSMARERWTDVRAAHVITSSAGPRPEAAAVADRLKIPLILLERSGEFRRRIITRSEEMLARGLTPNPCALCNAGVKLLSLFEILEPEEVIVTGHYAGKRNGLPVRGTDGDKDQSYFLSLVDPDIMARCRFPLQGMTKDMVRERALELRLPFRRRESMDLCFHMSAPGPSGGIVDIHGRELGRHGGIGGFTIGQRRGLGAHGERTYVLSINRETGDVTVGPKECLMSRACTVGELNWFSRPEAFPAVMRVQTRYRRKPVEAVLDEEGDSLHIEFSLPERSVAPGQVCAFYSGDVLTGGGIIESTEGIG